MTETKQIKFNSGTFYLFDSETMPFQEHSHLTHFALTDSFIQYAAENEQPIIHFWQTSPLVILGMMDTRIGNFNKALDILNNSPYDYVIRNSGGLAVVSDPGVLNVSLIYPSKKDNRLSIDQAYEFMLTFIRKTFYPDFPNYKIDAYEIEHSYCFGDYDLSIQGQKIAGISQRRIQNGIAIMLYISVNGNQQKRAELLQNFYEVGLDGTEPEGRYPLIKPDVMTTLEDAYETSLTVNEVKNKMLSHFNWSAGEYHPDIHHLFHKNLKKMYKRNQRFLGDEFIIKDKEGEITNDYENL